VNGGEPPAISERSAYESQPSMLLKADRS